MNGQLFLDICTFLFGFVLFIANAQGKTAKNNPTQAHLRIMSIRHLSENFTCGLGSNPLCATVYAWIPYLPSIRLEYIIIKADRPRLAIFSLYIGRVMRFNWQGH